MQLLFNILTAINTAVLLWIVGLMYLISHGEARPETKYKFHYDKYKFHYEDLPKRGPYATKKTKERSPAKKTRR